jgi:triosephosphate isomerase
MPRIKKVYGNWKDQVFTIHDALTLSANVCRGLRDVGGSVEVAIFPPFVYLDVVRRMIASEGPQLLKLGAQDVYGNEGRTFTGAISPKMLKNLEIEGCLTGHSERRVHFGETDLDVARKIDALIRYGIPPTLCVGESLETRKEGDEKAIAFVVGQVRAALQSLGPTAVGEIDAVAYEPVWAIGTGLTATPEQAQEMCAAIRACIANLVGLGAAEGMSVLYGGSMTHETAQLFASLPDVDGGLIGGASLVPDSFISIVKAFAD